MNAVTDDSARLRTALAAVVGDAHVLADTTDRRWFSQDIAREGVTAALVVAPGTVEELCAAVGAATRAGHAVFPRGGGTSYTGGFLPDRPASVVVDTRRLARIVDVSPADGHVTVEAGCTWQALHDALAPRGLKTPFWGPLSGAVSTIGGGLSQNAILWGSARHGLSADSVIGVDVALADGTLLATGAGAARGAPFLRNYGPDLAGLFLGDCGALGVKARATLKLVPRQAFAATASFGFDTHEAAATAMAEIVREGLVTECFGMDPELTRQRLKRAKLSQGVDAMRKLVATTGTLAGGLREAAKVALAGRGFLDDVDYSVHVGTEGRDERSCEAALGAAREIVRARGGREVPDSVPKLMRGSPFVPMSSGIGPAGERWLPVHALVPFSAAVATWSAVKALLAAHAERMQRHGVTVGVLTAVVGPGTFVLEPVFYWPAPRTLYYERALDRATLERFEAFPPNPDGEALVFEVRGQLARLFLERGASHLQVGRTYPYREAMPPAAWALLEGVKRVLDPARLMNPGSLGL